MDFEWDVAKYEANVRKHGITFDEAATIFDDPLAVTIMDPDHSIGEFRYVTFGTTWDGRSLVVAHTDPLDTVRMINARLMTKRERMTYERGE